MPQSSPFGGGFMRGGFFQGLAGGILGGMLGGLLFRGLGFAGSGFGGGLGGGIGLFEILLMAALAYGIYVFVKRRREAAYATGTSAYQVSGPSGYDSSPRYVESPSFAPSYSTGESLALKQDVDQGLSNIRMMDHGFDERRFEDQCSDLFFKVQAGWMNRDLETLRPILAEEMVDYFTKEIEQLRRDGKMNRLENIAVRSVEIAEAWQEQGRDYITVRFYANLLDYTVNEKTMEVVSGSKVEPVKFEEYWTFTRPVGPNAWKLSAIQQP
jgi:predicted lipid-binding transport protein (Tim44 family)